MLREMNGRAWNAPPECLDDLQPQAFDEYNADHIEHVAPHSLGSQIQGLLLARREWHMMNLQQRSEQMESLLDSLYLACRDKWRDDQ